MDFFQSHVSPRAVELAGEVLQSSWLSEGPMVRRFERELAERLHVSRPVAVNSGTAALHLALAVAGVKAGDEVILPAQTFVATGMAVLMQGATPVFADIHVTTGNLSVDSLRDRMTPRTRAVIPVHWAGYPCDMDEINAAAAQHDCAVIEDAAHALGATYRDRPIGAVSRFTAFSFQAIKHLTTGDGGALCCLRADDARDAHTRRWFGIDREKSEPSELGERVYDIGSVGFKYHMNDLAAAVGLGNLESFDGRLERRRALAARYRLELAGVPGLQLLDVQDDREHAFWLFTILVERREAFIRKLASAGIPTSVVHVGIDRNSVFGGKQDSLPGQRAFDARQISLPVHDGLGDDDLDRVVRVVRAGW